MFADLSLITHLFYLASLALLLIDAFPFLRNIFVFYFVREGPLDPTFWSYYHAVFPALIMSVVILVLQIKVIRRLPDDAAAQGA